MSTLNTLYKIDDLNLNKSSGYNFSQNYYDKKIKEGIPIFQEIGAFNNSINSQNYVDPFKLLENSKTNNFLNNGQGSGNDLGLGSFSSNLNMNDLETRKMIEREMNPYLLQMKNELNLIIEKFRKEMENKSNILNEISSLKDQASKNNQNIEINFSNLENKMFNIQNAINVQDKKINECQNEINKINRNDQSMNKKIDDLSNYLIDLNAIKNKLLSMDASNENIYKNISNNIEKMTNFKIDELSKNINLIKEGNIQIQNSIINNKNKIDLLNLENDKKNKKINEIEVCLHNTTNQINNINLNNNKNLNLINNFEIKNYDIQQKIKSVNDKISVIENNINSNLTQIQSNKQTLNSSSQKIFEIENSINYLKNEKQSFNNKIIELDLKINSQEEKISKNNNLLNDVINQNNTTLYKDLATQISKSNNLIDQLRDSYEEDISKIKNEINQLDTIIKNNPFLNPNENEKLSILFKKEQIKSNDIFREQIKIINEEINNLKIANPIDKSNFQKIEKNFKVIDNVLASRTKDIDLLEKGLKTTSQIVEALKEKIEKIKKEINSPKSDKNNGPGKGFSGAPMAGEYNFGEFDENIHKIQNYININKKDMSDLKLDIKEINEKTIHEIYKYINDKLKQFNSKYDNPESNISINREPINKRDGNKYKRQNSDIEFNNNIMLSNKNNNNNYYVNNQNNNFNNNLIKEKNINKKIENIEINNNEYNKDDNNENNNKIDLNNNQDIEDIANKIELMGSTGPKINNEFNKNIGNNDNVNININIERERNNIESSFDKRSSLNEYNSKKKDETNSSNSIDKLINDVMVENKENKENKSLSQKSQEDFDMDFDN